MSCVAASSVMKIMIHLPQILPNIMVAMVVAKTEKEIYEKRGVIS